MELIVLVILFIWGLTVGIYAFKVYKLLKKLESSGLSDEDRAMIRKAIYPSRYKN